MSNSKLGERAKKKAWYNVLYPSYKSRTEDFKKLFNLPEDERLIVGKYINLLLLHQVTHKTIMVKKYKSDVRPGVFYNFTGTHKHTK